LYQEGYKPLLTAEQLFGYEQVAKADCEYLIDCITVVEADTGFSCDNILTSKRNGL
jgi:hypothetical protein